MAKKKGNGQRKTGDIQALQSQRLDAVQVEYPVIVGQFANVKHLGDMKCVETGNGKLRLLAHGEEQVLEIRADARSIVPEKEQLRLGDYDHKVYTRKHGQVYFNKVKESGGTL